MNENELLEKEELRNKLVDRYDILEKVRELLLIPGTEFATTQQVADFYEVEKKTIEKVVERFNDELTSDGIQYISGNNIKEKLDTDNISVTNCRGYFLVEGIKIAYRSNTLFPRRAILRVGMLLRDSKVAKEVRTQLLNIEEKTDETTKLKDITEEDRLLLEIGKASALGTKEDLNVAWRKYNDFKDRHHKEAVLKLKTDNKALAEGILEWSNRSKLNAGMRKLSQTIDKQYGAVWNELYKNLYYNHHINLKARGKSPFIQYIKEEEWIYVIKTFAALCEDYGYSSSDMIDCKVKRTYSK